MTDFINPMMAGNFMVPGGMRGKLTREMSHRPMPGVMDFSKTQNALDALALGTSPVPLVGDVTGLAADAFSYSTDPESRNWLNYLLTGAGILPFVPSPRSFKSMMEDVKNVDPDGAPDIDDVPSVPDVVDDAVEVSTGKMFYAPNAKYGSFAPGKLNNDGFIVTEGEGADDVVRWLTKEENDWMMDVSSQVEDEYGFMRVSGYDDFRGMPEKFAEFGEMMLKFADSKNMPAFIWETTPEVWEADPFYAEIGQMIRDGIAGKYGKDAQDMFRMHGHTIPKVPDPDIGSLDQKLKYAEYKGKLSPNAQGKRYSPGSENADGFLIAAGEGPDGVVSWIADPELGQNAFMDHFNIGWDEIYEGAKEAYEEFGIPDDLAAMAYMVSAYADEANMPVSLFETTPKAWEAAGRNDIAEMMRAAVRGEYGEAAQDLFKSFGGGQD